MYESVATFVGEHLSNLNQSLSENAEIPSSTIFEMSMALTHQSTFELKLTLRVILVP
nr:MAG TPA: hypothetical protein [Bacteriophage sp.]